MRKITLLIFLAVCMMCSSFTFAAELTEDETTIDTPVVYTVSSAYTVILPDIITEEDFEITISALDLPQETEFTLNAHCTTDGKVQDNWYLENPSGELYPFVFIIDNAECAPGVIFSMTDEDANVNAEYTLDCHIDFDAPYAGQYSGIITFSAAINFTNIAECEGCGKVASLCPDNYCAECAADWSIGSWCHGYCEDCGWTEDWCFDCAKCSCQHETISCPDGCEMQRTDVVFCHCGYCSEQHDEYHRENYCDHCDICGTWMFNDWSEPGDPINRCENCGLCLDCCECDNN